MSSRWIQETILVATLLHCVSKRERIVKSYFIARVVAHVGKVELGKDTIELAPFQTVTLEEWKELHYNPFKYAEFYFRRPHLAKLRKSFISSFHRSLKSLEKKGLIIRLPSKSTEETYKSFNIPLGEFPVGGYSTRFMLTDKGIKKAFRIYKSWQAALAARKARESSHNNEVRS
jgi:hypothetical protein